MSQTTAVSVFAHAEDRTPVRHDLAWGEFAAQLQSNGFLPQAIKVKVPAFSPATFSDNRRLKANVESLHFAAIDLDGITSEQLTASISTFEANGIDYIFYTSYSHGIKSPGLWRCRFLLPYDRPITPLEYQQIWPRLRMLFSHIPFGPGKPLDSILKKPAQIYFIPSKPPDSPAEHLFNYHPGKPLPVDKLLASECHIPAEHLVEPGTQPCPQRVLAHLAKAYKRRSNVYDAEMGRTLTAVTKGESFAAIGDTDNKLWALATLLAKELPSVDPQAIADHFAPSLQLMNLEWEETHGQPGQMTVQRVREKIERAQLESKATAAKKVQAALERHQNRCAQAWATLGLSRHTPYSQTELDAMREMTSQTEVDHNQTWIAYKGNAIYFRLWGTYMGPFNRRDDGSLTAQTFLAPATSSGITLNTMTKQGQMIKKNQTQLCKDYGKHIDNIIVDLSAEQSYFEGSDFIESCFKPRDLTPQYNEHVHTWFQLLGGKKQELLLDWLVLAQDLVKPLSALFLHGAPGAGKSLFALGVSRLWTVNGPGSLDRALSKFNTQITHNPILFADESLPEDWRGNVKWDEIREIVQAQTRQLERKYTPESTVRGASRIIAAANNLSGLGQTRNLTENDISAVAERLLLIHVGDKGDSPAESHMIGLGSDYISDVLVDGDGIAKHLRWLKTNRVVKRQGRFGVVDPDKSVQRALSLSVGSRYYAMLFLVRALQDPQRRAFLGTEPKMILHEGGLWANTHIFSQFWETYIPTERMPAQKAMQQAFKSLCADRYFRPSTGGSRLRYRQVLTENLITFAEDQDEGTAESILATLQGPTNIAGIRA